IGASPQAALARAERRLSIGDLLTARRILLPLTQNTNTAHPDVLLHLAACDSALGLGEEAQRVAHAVMTRDKIDVQGYLALARALSVSGRREESAQTLFDAERAIDPK